MASTCVVACRKEGCPTPKVLRLSLPKCVVSDLRVVANMMQTHCGPAKPKTRQGFIDQINQRIDMCERMGLALFSRRAIDNMLSTADLRQRVKTALGITPQPQQHLPSAVRVVPIEDSDDEIWASPLHTQTTVVEMFERRNAGDISYEATPVVTLGEVAKQIPFYDIFGAGSIVKEFDVAYGQPLAVEGAFGLAPTADGDVWRVLMCFVAAHPPAQETDKHYLMWPPHATSVRLNGRVLARRGRNALPIDVTDQVQTSGGCGLVVSGSWEGASLLGIHAMMIVCRFDAVGAGGDASHYLRKNYVPVDHFNAELSADESVEAVGNTVSLVCPFSMCRIAVPVRSTTCRHAQCFDLGSLFMANAFSNAPKWVCPICRQPARADQVVIDSVITHALASDTQAEHIVLDATCTKWRDDKCGWQSPETG